MKKFLNLIVLGGSLFLAALVFAFMALPALSANLIIATAKPSFYDLLGDYGGLVATLIIFIVGFLAAGFVFALELIKAKFNYSMFVAFGAGFLLLIAGILFFCTAAIVDAGSLAAGSVLCGLLSIFAALGTCFYGCLAGKLIKL